MSSWWYLELNLELQTLFQVYFKSSYIYTISPKDLKFMIKSPKRCWDSLKLHFYALIFWLMDWIVVFAQDLFDLWPNINQMQVFLSTI